MQFLAIAACGGSILSFLIYRNNYLFFLCLYLCSVLGVFVGQNENDVGVVILLYYIGILELS